MLQMAQIGIRIMDNELIFKELSYKIVGLAFEIDNELGSGLPEKAYSNAFEQLLSREGIAFKKEVYCPIKIIDKVVLKQYIDFIVDNKIVVELKTGALSYKKVFTQVNNYLKEKDLKLGLIIRFTREGVVTKRVLNIRQ
jgi:GxxExxY protein